MRSFSIVALHVAANRTLLLFVLAGIVLLTSVRVILAAPNVNFSTPANNQMIYLSLNPETYTISGSASASAVQLYLYDQLQGVRRLIWCTNFQPRQAGIARGRRCPRRRIVYAQRINHVPKSDSAAAINLRHPDERQSAHALL